MALSGKEFKLKHKGPYFKMLNRERKHNGFQYVKGLNTDTIEFNPRGECQPGGLYFTDKANLAHWLGYGATIHTVTIPDDAQVYVEPKKFKADKFILEEGCAIENHDIWKDTESILQLLSTNGWALQYIKDQTPELCMAAVRQNGRILRIIKSQTPEQCMAAVQNDGMALEFVNDQTPEICMAAVQEEGLALEFVESQTPEICMAAVQNDGLALEFVNDKTPEICMAAVQQDGLAIRYVNDLTLEIRIAALQNIIAHLNKLNTSYDPLLSYDITGIATTIRNMYNTFIMEQMEQVKAYHVLYSDTSCRGDRN